MCSPDILTARYLDVLRTHLGLQADAPEDLDGAVVFRHGGLNHIMLNHAPVDPEFLDLHLPMSLGDEHDDDDVAAAAEMLTGRFKLVKAAPTEHGIVLAVESVVAAPHVVPGHGILLAVLPRFLAVLEDAVDALRLELQFRAVTSSLREE
jgi:hypothetical protein